MLYFIKIGFFFFSFCLLGVVSSGGHIIDPSYQLKKAVTEVLEIIYDNEPLDAQAKEKAILDTLSQYYDLDVIIRRSIGRNWEKIDLDHRDTILELIKQLVVRAYVDGMSTVSKPEIHYDTVRQLSPKRAEVQTNLSLGDQSIQLSYRFGQMSSKWQIFDILIENISLVATYRNQFDAFFIRNDSHNLIIKLQELLSDENLGQSLPL